MNDSKKTAMLSECKVCSSQARYSYYGAVVCQSCKMFFKRNAEHQRSLLKCILKNNCQININQRPMCPSCRLKKCFQIGMCSKMIRGSYGQNSRSKIINKSNELINNSKISQLITSSSRLILNTDQWNILSNLIGCFDKYVDDSIIQRFINEQNNLPVKYRFKFSTTKDFFTSTKANIQLVSENNPYFNSLSQHDRQILLKKTVKHVTSLGGMFVLYKYRLFDQASFYNSAEMIFCSNATILTRCFINQLDSDEIFIKLVMAILSFSTFNYTIYEQSNSDNLINLKKILFIQDIYTEITWRYLVYRYNYNDAVRRFSNLIRCLFIMNNAVVEAEKSQQFTDMIDSVMKQTENNLIV